MLGYLSLDIIFSSKLTVFLELRSLKIVRSMEQIMSMDKYASLFSCQMEATVYIVLNSHGQGWHLLRMWSTRVQATQTLMIAPMVSLNNTEPELHSS